MNWKGREGGEGAFLLVTLMLLDDLLALDVGVCDCG